MSSRVWFAAPGVYVVKGPATVFANGPCRVLAKDVSDKKTTIRAGKALPFEYGSACRLEVRLGRGGAAWQADPTDAGACIWHDVGQKMLEIRPKRIILVGDSDAGKSTLSAYLINLAIQHGLKPGVLDGDIGQGDLAPPAAMGAAAVTKQVVDLRQVQPQVFEFVGDTTPAGFEQIITAKLKLMLEILQSSGCNLCVINTDGYVRDAGVAYKQGVARELQVDMVVCMGPSAPLLSDAISEVSHFSIVMEAHSAGQAVKSRAERAEIRFSRFLKYTRGSRITRDLSNMTFTYRDQNFSGIALEGSGPGLGVDLEPHSESTPALLPVEKSRIQLADLRRMFVGLGLEGKVSGFGIITGVSSRRISIQTPLETFDRIYLSRIGLKKGRAGEFRIF